MNNISYEGMSENVLRSFESLTYSMNEMEYSQIYKKISENLPQEGTTFFDFDLEQLIACEVICAAICNKINWDFLRKIIFNKTLENPSWLFADNLVLLKPSEVAVMLSKYEKKERIMAKERCEMLVEVGKRVQKGPQTFKSIFFRNETELNTYEQIVEFFDSISVFSSDPQKKIATSFPSIVLLSTIYFFI